VYAHFWWLALSEMQIGAAVFDDYAEKLIQVSHLVSDERRMPKDEGVTKLEC
jgi:hypothetical protein